MPDVEQGLTAPNATADIHNKFTGLIYRGRHHPIQMDPVEEIKSPFIKGSRTYKYFGINFLDNLQETANAGLFVLPRHTASRSVLITGDVICHDVIVGGVGSILLLNPEGKIEVKQLDRQNREVTTYGRGSFLSYISSNVAFRLLGVYEPKWEDNMEIAATVFRQAKVGNTEIPPEYWDIYSQIIRGSYGQRYIW